MKKFFNLTTRSFEQHSVTTLKELWEKAQKDGYEGIAVTCSLNLEPIVDETAVDDTAPKTKKFHAVFSSETEDRHGDIVYQNFDLKSFRKNPVFLDSHNYGSIEHIIGRIQPISVKDDKLQGDIEFAMDNPKGVLAHKLAEGGFLNTTSIGFIPREFDDTGNITKSELLEISAVSVPANPEALFEKDHDTTPEPIEPPQDDTSSAPSEEPVETSPAPKPDPKRAARNAVRDLIDQRQRHLKIIARELSKITEPVARKRKIYQSLREVLKADIAA